MKFELSHPAPLAGESPHGWRVCRVKDALEFFNTRRVPLSAAERGEMTERAYDYYGASGVIDRVDSYLFDGTYILLAEDGANLLTRSKPLAFLAKGRFWVNNHAHILRPQQNGDLAFFVTLLETLDYSMFVTGAAQPKLTMENLGRCRLAVPPLLEQRRIASYLDASCAAIDAAVDAKRGQLKTLDALTLTVIHQAVTRGVSGGVKLKQSGIDWLPEVPHHWQIQQIKRSCEIVRGKFTHRPRNDPAFYGGEYPFVQTGDITAARKYIRTWSQTLNDLGLSVSKMFPRGTLVMSIAANIGDVAIVDFEACFPDSMVGLIPNHKTDLNFLYYMMRAMKGIMLRSAVISTQLNLNNVRIGTNSAAFPPLKEQEAIGKYLDAKEEEASLLKQMLNLQIDTLRAYRKSLIHECITGQRRITAEDLNRASAVAAKALSIST